MKRKIAILGASGMLGSMVLDVLSRDKDLEILATVRSYEEIKTQKKFDNVKFIALDVEHIGHDELKKALKSVKWVINCIGIIKPYIHDDNALEVERALRINALFPHILAKAVRPAKVIQIATDCVYSGQRGQYEEDNLQDALDVYGKTKALGEVYADNMINLRSSIVGPELQGHLSLLDWFLSRPKGAKINGYKNHFWSGITTYHFAKICGAIIKSNLKINHLQHVVPSDKISKCDLLKSFAKEFKRQDVKIVPVNEPEVINRTLRTKNPDVNKTIWATAGYKKIPTIAEMICELAQYRKEQL